jgi:hypothetical protein
LPDGRRGIARRFADGVTRPVSLDAAGKQDVVGPDGGRVSGVWLPPSVSLALGVACQGPLRRWLSGVLRNEIRTRRAAARRRPGRPPASAAC